MASSSGSGSSSLPEVIEQRKRKRMLSNRESARRSRQRKQNHLDELTAQVSQLKKENAQIVAAISFSTQKHMGVEDENIVLRTQMVELSRRLESLNEILRCIGGEEGSSNGGFYCDDGMRPWSLMGVMNQPVLASVDSFASFGC